MPSAERIAEYVAGAERVLSDDLPAGNKLWKSWALGLADNVLALSRKNDSLVEQLEALATARDLVDEQAEDEGLWFIAESAPEAYLQQELRRLHAAIERAAPPDEIRVHDLWHDRTCAIFSGSLSCSCGAVTEAVKTLRPGSNPASRDGS